MNDSIQETNSFTAFTDADLKAALRRAFRSCIAMGIIGAGAFAFLNGWRSALHCLAGATVSLLGLYEWQQLIDFVNARLDNQKPPRSTARVIFMFLVRLGFAGGVIYGSLKFSRGTPYGLLTGLGLAVIALTIEAVRLIRS